jgi:uncharacterized membrane protein (DUF4010 family)
VTGAVTVARPSSPEHDTWVAGAVTVCATFATVSGSLRDRSRDRVTGAATWVTGAATCVTGAAACANRRRDLV